MAPKRIAMGLDGWPRPDRLAWDRALASGDIFEAGGLGAAWAPTTRSGVAASFGRWLAWLAARGLFDPERSAMTHATRENLEAYIEHLRTRYASSTASTYLSFLAMALHVLVPSSDWTWLNPAVAALRRRATSVRNKRSRLQMADDLYALGLELMEAAAEGNTEAAPGATTWESATKFRDGLIISLLALCPFRRRNFGSIEIGRNLTHRAGAYWLLFERDETKNRQPIEVPFPAVLVPALERYLKVYRPWLGSQTSNRDPRYPFKPAGKRLWVSKTGSSLSPESFYQSVLSRTAAKFGRSVNPHLFRDCAATTIATSDPEHVRITTSVLGHSSLATSENSYNHAQALEACRRVQDGIIAFRRSLGARQKIQKPDIEEI